MDSGRPRLADGRAIGVATFGAPDGRPVVALHGMPGSRLMFAAVDAAAARQGVRIIALDRPGYGVADPHPGGTLLGYASDVEFSHWMTREIGVAPVPGSSFFANGENRYVRLNFAKRPETLHAAGERMLKLRR